MITVYGRPGCSACYATRNYLNRHHIDHLEVDVSVDPAARAYVQRLGYASLPVVVAGAQHWAGFRAERLLELRDM